MYGYQFSATHSLKGILWIQAQSKINQQLNNQWWKKILHLLNGVTQLWTAGLQCSISWSCFHLTLFGIYLEVLSCIFCVYHFIQVTYDNNWHFKAPLTLVNFKLSFIPKGELCKECLFNVSKSDKTFSSIHPSLSVIFNSISECVSRKETKLLKLEKFWTLFKSEKG